jgi:hypothetical protein
MTRRRSTTGSNQTSVRWRSSRRHHARHSCARGFSLAGGLRRASGPRPGRLLSRDRRPRLCAARDHSRDAAHRHRQGSGGRPARIPEVRGLAPDASTLLDWILHDLPPRAGIMAQTPSAQPLRVPPISPARRPAPSPRLASPPLPSPPPNHRPLETCLSDAAVGMFVRLILGLFTQPSSAGLSAQYSCSIGWRAQNCGGVAMPS